MNAEMIIHLRPNLAGSNKETAGVVCPVCFKPITRFNLYGPDEDGFGRTLRSYIGYCDRCRDGFEVVQFAAFGVWPMAAYHLDRRDWVTCQDLPKITPKPVAPVITGPGGDYYKGYTPEVASFDALKKMEENLTIALDIVRELMSYARRR